MIHCRKAAEIHYHLSATELKPGFVFEGERIPLVNPQRGIFKPQQMRFLLSIKTVFPKPGDKLWLARPQHPGTNGRVWRRARARDEANPPYRAPGCRAAKASAPGMTLIGSGAIAPAIQAARPTRRSSPPTGPTI